MVLFENSYLINLRFKKKRKLCATFLENKFEKTFFCIQSFQRNLFLKLIKTVFRKKGEIPLDMF